MRSKVFITYFVAGLILLPIIQKLGKFSVVSYYVLAGIIAFAGLLEIKDFFWYGKGWSLAIMPSESQRIKKYVKHVGKSGWAAFLMGVFVALVELPCTGVAYLAVLGLDSILASDAQARTYTDKSLLYDIFLGAFDHETNAKKEKARFNHSQYAYKKIESIRIRSYGDTDYRQVWPGRNISSQDQERIG